jgi:hypothetical protein
MVGGYSVDGEQRVVVEAVTSELVVDEWMNRWKWYVQETGCTT